MIPQADIVSSVISIVEWILCFPLCYVLLSHNRRGEFAHLNNVGQAGLYLMTVSTVIGGFLLPILAIHDLPLTYQSFCFYTFGVGFLLIGMSRARKSFHHASAHTKNSEH